MSSFLIYDPENYEYILQPLGYVCLSLLLFVLLAFVFLFAKRRKSRRVGTKELVFCSMAMALSTVASFIKFVNLPYGGSITLFSMLFVSLIGYFYGPKTGLITGVAYGVLQLITGPYIYAPLQVLLDYPLAFGALGLSGFFHNKKYGLLTGYIVGVTGRYLSHVISGYIFFAEYAPEGMNALLYTFGYNLTYVLPELLLTAVLLAVPAVKKAIGQVKQQACAS
ncbi:MAG: energy-coupled thiamine transporter ThiT [Lachnospiraceae bacterium]|jgi:thiamine transporter|nr:energy-coupled thiamine transporter ThiT [Lachnospiraceae bacterium]